MMVGSFLAMELAAVRVDWMRDFGPVPWVFLFRPLLDSPWIHPLGPDFRLDG